MHEAGNASCNPIKHLHKAGQSRLAQAKASSRAFTDRPAGATSKFTFAAGLPFNDGEHIIYVNGAMKGSDTALAKLMSDFFCTEAKDMNYKELSEKVRYFKESEKGVERMFDSLEDMRNEVRIETALKMIAGGKLSLEDIASYSGLPLDKVKELAEAKTA
ncbi:hypothetical protein [Butyrivibrio sp. AE2032]|uniref:hypothetical protein n=1 Tax=Butyrivibrio sp. AE2032 TaxID=1458463 RepID=UPI00068A016D|nr:hypothetical protein [Butyrivibrio sp. AE2032]